MKIGVFDSGIGGITVLNKLIKKYPNCEYIYYGDTANIPFGDKSVDELKIIADNIVNFLINKNVDIIVIACGTLSSNLTDYLKRKYDIPIYDIVSSTINYINESNYNNIGVLCTKGTKDSGIFEQKIEKKVEVLECPGLADLIEENDVDSIRVYISKKVEILKDVDIIVLGCTHYPIIKDKIREYTDLPILDMSDYFELNIKEGENFKLKFYFSIEDDVLLKNVKRILKTNND